MSLSIGIAGLPNVGKSTLFNALTDNEILAANYPFATIELNTGIVPVPNKRLDKLAEIYKPQKVIPAVVKFVDIAGLVAGASQGEGLGNQFLSHIRSCNAICHVVRAFEDSNVQRVKNPDASVGAPTSDSIVGASEDIEIINTELVLADLSTLENRRSKLVKDIKSNPKLKTELENIDEAKALLARGVPLFNSSIIQRLSSTLQSLQLLTAKPVIYLFNVDEATLADSQKQAELKKLVAPAEAVFVNAKLEDELRGLADDEAKELLAEYNVGERGLDKVIHSAYGILGLQSFLTAGEKEVRAWTIKKGATAPQAAGTIHGDFEKGFIAAQVVDYNDLVQAGSEAAAKAAGKVRTEGKDYVMQPNDIVEFRFNV